MTTTIDHDDAPTLAQEDPQWARLAPIRRAPVPHAPEAEKALLGAMLGLSEEATAAGLTLDPTDFYGEAHPAIHAAIARVTANGAKPDVVTVGAELRITGELDLVGGYAALTELQANTPYSGNAGAYAAIVAKAARLRRILLANTEVTYAIQRGEDPAAALERLDSVRDASDPAMVSSWMPVDIGAVLEGELGPSPVYGARTDGNCLFYAGRIHAILGPSEGGKTWAALAVVAERLVLGETVLYVDFEDSAAGIAGRLVDMGMPSKVLETSLIYVRPDDPYDSKVASGLRSLIAKRIPTVAVLDGITEAMNLAKLKILDNDDVATFYGSLPRMLARTGIAVVMIDHVPKNRDATVPGGIGAQHKRAGIDGASYLVETTEVFGRGRRGTARITVDKDKGGHVRGFAADGRRVATLVVDSTRSPLAVSLLSTREGPDHASAVMMEQVCRAVGELNDTGQPTTIGRLRKIIASGPGPIQVALATLVDKGHLRAAPAQRGAMHYTLDSVYLAPAPEPAEGLLEVEEPVVEEPSFFDNERF